MKVRWSGVILVGLLVLGTLFLKSRTRQIGALDATKGIPSVILVADPSKANDSDDGCAVMFRAVRHAAKRGVVVGGSTKFKPGFASSLSRSHCANRLVVGQDWQGDHSF